MPMVAFADAVCKLIGPPLTADARICMNSGRWGRILLCGAKNDYSLRLTALHLSGRSLIRRGQGQSSIDSGH
jgi:hypothetical protein